MFWCAFDSQELQALVTAHGFDAIACVVREPLPDEIAVRRIYLTAKRAAEWSGTTERGRDDGQVPMRIGVR